MLIEILKRTPSWVFVLFFALLALGYLQSRDRSVSRSRIAILPLAMTGLSFYGVVSAFGIVPFGFSAWVAGVTIAVAPGVRLATARSASFTVETQLFCVPGSWFPLALMMAIFFTKYAVGVILARQLPIAGEPVFIGAVSLCYGLLSGVFLARMFGILRCAEGAAKTMPDRC